MICIHSHASYLWRDNFQRSLLPPPLLLYCIPTVHIAKNSTLLWKLFLSHLCHKWSSKRHQKSLSRIKWSSVKYQSKAPETFPTLHRKRTCVHTCKAFYVFKRNCLVLKRSLPIYSQATPQMYCTVKRKAYIHLIHSPSHFWLIPIGQYQQYKIYISDHKSPERGRLIPPGTSLSEYLMNTWWKADSKSMCRWSHMLTCSYLSSWISYYSYTSIKASAQTVSWHAGEFQLGVSGQAGNVSHSRPCHTAIWSTA